MAQNIVTQSAGTALPWQLQRSWRKAFQERTQGMALERWRCVGIDIGKYEHVAVLQDGQGRILAGPLRFGISQAEMERFHTWLSPWVSGKDVELFIGMEPTGHYYESCAHALAQRYGVKQIYLIQARDTAHQRGEWNQGSFKNDEVDACIIAELLRRGHGRPYQAAQGPYLALYHLERYRLAQEKACTRLKNQIIGHVDRLYPGLVIQHRELAERYKPLFRGLWTQETPRRLLELYANPYSLHQQTAEDLVRTFHAANYWMSRPYAQTILTAVKQLCLPDPSLAAIRSRLLYQDLQRLARMEQELADTEAVMVSHLDETWGRWLRSTGVDPARLACLVATIGDLNQYPSARQLFGRSGLHSRCTDSGTRQQRGQGEPMVKAGDRHLRRQLMRFAVCMIARYPSLRSYTVQLQKRGKNATTAQVAVARKLTSIIYAIGTRQAPFDPAFLA